MKIAYGMPAVTNVTLAGGTWLTADEGSALFDGKPARKSRINRTGSLSLTITLASAITPRVIALLGLNLPAGVAITAATATATTRAMPDGSVCAWLFPLASATNTVTVSITTTQATVEIGEIAIMRAIEVGIRDGWQVDYVDASRKERTKGCQLNTIPGAKWRRFTGELSQRSVEQAIKGGIAGTDWETVANALTGSGKGAIIPMHRDMLTKQFDPELAARSAIYGHAIELSGYTNVQRQYFSSYLALRRFRDRALHYKSITRWVTGTGLAKLQALGVGSPPIAGQGRLMLMTELAGKPDSRQMVDKIAVKVRNC